jgi:hypothetical protein
MQRRLIDFLGLYHLSQKQRATTTIHANVG